MSDSLHNARALVVGGAGLIGSHITDLLLEEGVREVRVFDSLVRGTRDNLNDALGDKRCKLIEGDIRDRAAVRSAMAGCDYVSHQAAIRITLCAAQPRECLEVLVEGAFNVFEAAAAAGVRKVVYASSASVYGQAEVFPTAESHHPYGNRTLYGSAKLFDEGIARHFHEINGLASVGLRYFNVYGPRMDVTGAYTEVFMKWLECIERGLRPQIHGDGSATMDLVYVGDVARANVLALKSTATDVVYNIASGTETSLLDLWRALQRVAGGRQLEPEFHPPRQLGAMRRRLAETLRAREDLGFVARVSLDEGLRRLTAWRHEQLSRQEVGA
ncbi:MAG TPA: NAD-dependent epimerase/dehydratase family protein [Gemmataceae bacterium]|nr:NAD-dependent epimerase/dehydratase family protein [Gemmataceae bacterium]